MADRRGFTLIELSIVLVIIGLIVGGVLVGQDLINAATIRAQITQIEKYKSAVNTFRGKYDYLPGDLPLTPAASYGFNTRYGLVGDGDGNGLIEECATGATGPGCETALFWSDLNQANLIEGAFSTNVNVNGSGGITFTSWNLIDELNPIPEADAVVGSDHTRAEILPTGKINGNYLTVFSAGGINYFQLTGVNLTVAFGTYNLGEALTPIQAYAIDAKMDDGLPLTGSVQAMEGTGPLNTQAVPGVSTCVSSAVTPNPYNVTVPTQLCELRFSLQ